MYVGLDPSFTGCGISIIHQDLKRVEFLEESVELDKKSTWIKFEAINKMASRVQTLIGVRCNSDAFFIGQEISTAYTGWFVAELFGLAYAINKALLELDPPVYNLYSQEYIKFIHGHKRTKEDTIFLIEDKILPIFKKYNYSIDIQKTEMTSTGVKEEGKNRYIRRETITNNEADSFIYALRQFVKYSTESDLVNELLEVCPLLAKDGKELK